MVVFSIFAPVLRGMVLDSLVDAIAIRSAVLKKKLTLAASALLLRLTILMAGSVLQTQASACTLSCLQYEQSHMSLVPMVVEGGSGTSG